jgi:hypothetical protein
LANKKITELTNLQTPVANTQFVAVDIENDETKSVTLANLISTIDTNENQNVVAIQANVASIVDTDEHTVTLSANLVPSIDGTYDLGSSSLKWKDLHLTGSSIKLGGITISDLGNEGFTITGTSGEQANITTPALGGVANVALELSDLQSRLTTNVTAFTNEDTALQARLTTNVTAFTNEDTALQSRLDTNVTLFTNEDTALQSRLDTNVTLFTNEDTALQSRLDTNVTLFTNEDTALQARITANNTLAASNDFVTYTRLNANIDLVQDNVASIVDATAVETRLNANLDIVSDNAAAVETRRVANIAGAISTVLTGDLTASRALASDGSGKISVATTTLDELNHVNGVTSAIQTQLDAVEARRAANNITTTFTDDVIVTGNLTVNGDTVTINTTNMDVDDTMIMLANGTTGSPANDIGILFNRGDEGNAAFFYDESATTFKLSDTKDPTSNTSLSPVTAANLSVGIVDAATLKYDGLSVDTSISDNVASLTTDINTVSSNTTAVESRRVANIAGAISSVLTSDLTADRVMITDGSGKISQSSGVTPTELDYLDGITLGTTAASKAVTSDASGDTSFSNDLAVVANTTLGTNASNTVTIIGILDCGAFS